MKTDGARGRPDGEPMLGHRGSLPEETTKLDEEARREARGRTFQKKEAACAEVWVQARACQGLRPWNRGPGPPPSGCCGDRLSSGKPLMGDSGPCTLAVSMSDTGSPRMSLGPSNVPDSSLGSPGNESTATELDGAGCGLWGPGCASWERTLVTRPQPSACSRAPGQDPL